MLLFNYLFIYCFTPYFN